MMELLYLLLAFGASTIGSIAGIGGGVIIRPVMDVISPFSAQTISFLSGCTVLAMAVANYIRNLKSEIKLDYRVSTFLGIGASIGGILGNQTFTRITYNAGLIQTVLLLLIIGFVLTYVLLKHKITTRKINSLAVCAIVGVGLGFISAFLGIGGGPLNIVVLYYFFSMGVKEAARNSLFIILIAHFTSLVTHIGAGTVPDFSALVLVLMCAGGIGGAMVGTIFSRRVKEDKVEKVFLYLLLALIVINVFNIISIITS